MQFARQLGPNGSTAKTTFWSVFRVFDPIYQCDQQNFLWNCSDKYADLQLYCCIATESGMTRQHIISIINRLQLKVKHARQFPYISLCPLKYNKTSRVVVQSGKLYAAENGPKKGSSSRIIIARWIVVAVVTSVANALCVISIVAGYYFEMFSLIEW